MYIYRSSLDILKLKSNCRALLVALCLEVVYIFNTCIDCNQFNMNRTTAATTPESTQLLIL